MSSKYPSSRKSDVNGDGPNDPINPFSLGFKPGFEDLDQILRNIFRAASSSEENMRSSNSVYYGYQIAVGPDGKPHVREFGNIWQTNNGTD